MPWTRDLRSSVGRLMRDDESPTMPGVFLDRGAYRAGAPQSGLDSRVFDVMDLALRCGAQLMARGAAAVDVESAMHAAATTLGLRNVEVDVTYNSLWISAVHTGQPVAASRVVRQGTPDYQRLTLVHRLLTDIVGGHIGLADAKDRMAVIEARPRAHGQRVVLLGFGVLAGSVAVLFGSGALVALVAALTGSVIVWLADRLSGPRTPALFLAAVGGLVAVAAAAWLTYAEVQARPSLIVAASIVVLLPGVALVGSVRDALAGFPLTAMGRAIDGTLVVLGVVAGVLVALKAVAALSIPMQIIPADAQPTPLLLGVIAGALAAASAAVVYQAPWRQVAVSSGIGAVGLLSWTAVTSVLDSPTLAIGAAAVAIGTVASWAAHRATSLALIFVVPGIMPLLPGLMLYRGTLLLTNGDTVDGLVVLLEAAVRMSALAAGALLGELLFSRFTRTW